MALQAGRVGVRADQVDSYGRVNDTSFFNKIIDKLITWVDLPVWKGGTEQLLPENDDEPETSPILCDIDYPDQERKNQYFTYRESPTGSDGIAKIESIRGNTLVWNQIVDVSMDAFTGNYFNEMSYTVSDNSFVGTYVASSNARNYGVYSVTKIVQANHKYFIKFDLTASRSGTVYYGNNTTRKTSEYTSGTTTTYKNILDNITTTDALVMYLNAGTTWIADDTLMISKPVLFDLTLMFGAGKEPTTVAQFESLFPLPYYAYDTGSLLNFTADKIKTVGKNLVYKILEGSNIESGGNISSPSAEYSCAFARIIKGETYVITNGVTASSLYAFFEDEPVVGDYSYDGKRYVVESITFTAPITGYVGFRIAKTYTTPQLEFGTTRTTYEPYITNTLELPISDFFPTGMKSAGEVYDELLPRRATTNVGEVDLGTLNWTYDNDVPRFYSTDISTLIKKVSHSYDVANIICPKYSTTNIDDIYQESVDKVTAVSTGGAISIKDTSYSEAAAFKLAMDGVMLNYELAEPIVLPTIDFGD